MNEEIQRIVFITHPLWPAIIPRYPVEGDTKKATIVDKGHFRLNVPAEGETANQQRRTPNEVKKFIEGELKQTIRKIKGNFIIVFVPTPQFHRARPNVTSELLQKMADKHGFGKINEMPPGETKKFDNFLKHRLSTFFRVGPKAQRKARGVEKSFYYSLREEFPGRVCCAHGKYGLQPKEISREVFEFLNAHKVAISKKAVVIGMGAWAESCAKNYSSEYAKLQGLRQTVARKGSISIKAKVRPAKKRVNKVRR